ncbi:transcriptional regulator [Listeria ivanovii]|nr:transcriptional regulator [Listeria ivanovii]PZF93041.1 transcriptional regulator [Listeria ivanovii]PZG03955.1 transcriptional regulator [Listeria ivanovii]PZG08362.1 transcriptional regulator [Listeria ivanovii]PZG25193.1 transcriptional regulator [Listeria ivanovii]
MEVRMKQNNPKYIQLANDLKEKIDKKTYNTGDTIPTESVLSAQYSVSRITVRKAVAKLIDEGYLESVQGSGTYVKEKIVHDLFELKSFGEEMDGKDRVFSSEILQYEIQKPSKEIAQKLQISEQDRIYYIRRSRVVNNSIFAVEDTFMPLSLFPDLTYEIMQGSKYDYIEKQKGIRIKSSQQEFTPILPNEAIAALFQIPTNKPILEIKSIGILETNIPFEVSNIYYKSSEYKFTITSQRKHK